MTDDAGKSGKSRGQAGGKRNVGRPRGHGQEIEKLRQAIIANPRYLTDRPDSVALEIAKDVGKASSVRRLQEELQQKSPPPTEAFPSLPDLVPMPPDPSAMLEPDWPIAELFRHVNPAVVGEREPGPVLKETGRAILDKLAIGRMSAWGRRDWDDYGDDQHSSTQVPIRREYWETAQWTYFFLEDPGRERVHCDLPWHDRRSEGYRDIQVNRAQVLAIWPSSPQG